MSKSFESLLNSLHNLTSKDSEIKDKAVESFNNNLDSILQTSDDLRVECLTEFFNYIETLRESLNSEDKLTFISFLSSYAPRAKDVKENWPENAIQPENMEKLISQSALSSLTKTELIAKIQDEDLKVGLSAASALSEFHSSLFDEEQRKDISTFLFGKWESHLQDISESISLPNHDIIKGFNLAKEQSKSGTLQIILTAILPFVLAGGEEMINKAFGLILDKELILQNKALALVCLSFLKDVLAAKSNFISEKENEINDSNQITRIANFALKCLESLYTEVRFHGSHITESIILKIKLSSENLFKEFIPRICFNRLYPAHSLSQLSLAIWKKAVGTEGKRILGNMASTALPFYLSQIKSPNHEVREAACKCIQEIYSKVVEGNEEATIVVGGFVGEVLEALTVTCSDTHFNVREYSFFALIKLYEHLEKRGNTDNIETFLSISLIHFGESHPEVRKASSHLLATITFKDPIQDQTFKSTVSTIFSKFRECIGKNEGELVIEEEKCFEGHRHFGSFFCGLLEFVKERVLLSAKYTDLEVYWNEIFDHYHFFTYEKAKSQKILIWMILNEIILAYGKANVKLILDPLLLALLSTYSNTVESKTDLPLLNSLKECGRKIVSFIGPMITKARAESLENGKFMNVYSEAMGN